MMFIILKAENDLDRSNWLVAFKAPFQPTVEERTDQQGKPVLLLSTDEFEGITDRKALFEIGKVRVRELNSIIGSNVTVDGVAEIVGGVVRRHIVMEAEPGRYEIKGGFTQIKVLALDESPKPQLPSEAQEQYRAARLDNHIAQALAYTTGKPDFIDLYTALECLEAGKFVTKRDSMTERFARTANAIFRHPTGKFQPPNKPVSIEEAHAHIRSLINKAIESILAANPL